MPVPALRVAPPETPPRSGVALPSRPQERPDRCLDRIGGNALDRDLRRSGRAPAGARRAFVRRAPPAARRRPSSRSRPAPSLRRIPRARPPIGSSSELGVAGQVAFAPDRGLYRVLLGSFPTRAEADAFLEKLKAGGQDGFVVAGAARPPEPAAGAAPPAAAATITVTGAGGAPITLASPVDLYGPAPEVRVVVDGVPYRGSLRVLVNPRGTLNVVNRVDLEDYLYGVVPAEMGPKRFDAIEALKAQAVAARTYALAHRGQFEAEGYDICPGPKCQAYGGASVEDPLSTAAVDGTRGLVLAHDGQFRRRSLRLDLRRRHGKRGERLLGRPGALSRLGRVRRARRPRRSPAHRWRATAPVRGRRSNGGVTFCAVSPRRRPPCARRAWRPRRSLRECASGRRRPRG